MCYKKSLANLIVTTNKMVKEQQMQFFVTGTGKNVGKTVVTKALLQAFNHVGYCTAGYKPVEFLSEENHVSYRDTTIIQEVSSLSLTEQQINPFSRDENSVFQPDCPPIDFNQLSQGLKLLREQAEIVVIDGSNGWFAPVSPQQRLSDWVISEQLHVILVVGIQVDCINHALLTAEVVRSKGLTLAGWVVNRINPGLSCYAETITMLNQILNAPLLGKIPYIGNPKQRDLSNYIDLSAILPDRNKTA